MPIKFAAITPHPPIIIPAIGKKEIIKVRKTITALKALKKDFIKVKPETVIIISPHTPMLPNLFTTSSKKFLQGNLNYFGEPNIKIKFANDLNLIQKIYQEMKRKKMPFALIENSDLDHGSLVPLLYLINNNNFKIILLSLSNFNSYDHFEYGKVISKVIKKELNKNIAIIASGDLSHKLIENAPAGFSPRAKEFDNKLIKLLKNKRIQEILSLDENLIKEAGECGLRSFIILLGILNSLEYNVKILSYEGPFGVGYLVAKFLIK